MTNIFVIGTGIVLSVQFYLRRKGDNSTDSHKGIRRDFQKKIGEGYYNTSHVYSY